jgi:NADPH:quinone reductase
MVQPIVLEQPCPQSNYRLAGLELWGTARGEHAPLVRKLGATPIDYQREDFTRVLPEGFDVIVDGVGEAGYRRSYAALKRGGLLCAIGFSASVQAQRRMLRPTLTIAQGRTLVLQVRSTGFRVALLIL